MDKRKAAVPVLALLTSFSSGFSAPLNAGDLNYTYVEGRFILDAELDDGPVNDDGDGIRFGGSFQVTNNVFAFGSYEDSDLDDTNVDLTFLKLGGGYIHPLNADWDANVSLAYVDFEADGPRSSADDDGYELSGGVRGKINPQIELRGHLKHIDLDDSDTYFTLGADYYIQSNFSAGVEIDLGGDYETLSIGARYFF